MLFSAFLCQRKPRDSRVVQKKLMNKTNNDRNSLAHTVWNCKYHIVFAPKYHIKVFFKKIKGLINWIFLIRETRLRVASKTSHSRQVNKRRTCALLKLLGLYPKKKSHPLCGWIFTSDLFFCFSNIDSIFVFLGRYAVVIFKRLWKGVYGRIVQFIGYLRKT